MSNFDFDSTKITNNHSNGDYSMANGMGSETNLSPSDISVFISGNNKEDSVEYDAFVKKEEAEKEDDKIKRQHVERNDATRVSKNIEVPEKRKISAEDRIEQIFIENGVSKEEIALRKHPKYKETYDAVLECYKLHRDEPVIIDKKEINHITRMVLKLTDKYKISEFAPIIADRMGKETGGYVFTKEILDKNSAYKGVMQVDKDTCCSIYGEDFDGKNTKDKERYEHWHNKYFAQDDEHIKLLKKKYPRPRDLFNEIKTNVELGLELGIIAFKAKLLQANNDPAKALKIYRGKK